MALTERQFDEFFRFVVSGFCPLNPPKLGDFEPRFRFKVPQNGGFGGLPELTIGANRFCRTDVNRAISRL